MTGKPHVSGNVTVVCLTAIILVSLGLLTWLAASGQDAPVVFAAIAGLLGAAVPGVINTLKVEQVVQQTNGNTKQLLNIVEQTTAGPVHPAPPVPPGPGPELPPPELPRHRLGGRRR